MPADPDISNIVTFAGENPLQVFSEFDYGPYDHSHTIYVEWKLPSQDWADANASTISIGGGSNSTQQWFWGWDLGAAFDIRFKQSSGTGDPEFPWHYSSWGGADDTNPDATSLANIALGHLGTTSIEAFNESSPEGVHVRRHWNLVRDALLRQRHWNFAIKRVELKLDGLVEMTGGSVTRGDETVTVASTTGLAVGQTLIGSGIPTGTKVASVTDGTHFEMDAAATTTGSSLAISAYDAPAFDYQFAYVLPTDYLRALNWNGREAGTSEAGYDIESGLLLTDDDSAQLRYVAKVTDPSSWDDSFKEAFCLRLAARVATGITTAQGLAAQLDQRAEQYMQKAFGPDNGETKPRAVLAQNGSGWLDARNGFDSRFG